MKKKIEIILVYVFIFVVIVLLVVAIAQSVFLLQTKDKLMGYMGCGLDLDECSSLCLEKRGINDCYAWCIVSHQNCVRGVISTFPTPQSNLEGNR